MKHLVPWAVLAVTLGASCTLNLAGKPGGGSGGGATATAATTGSGGGEATSGSGLGGEPAMAAATTSTTGATVTVGSGSSSSGSGGGATMWTRRRQLDLDSGANGTFNNIPILIVLATGRIDYAQTRAQGQDIRFVDDTGAVLAHEIELWDESGTSLVWVKIPALKKNGANLTQVWMYYGNAGAPDGQQVNAVWSDGYRGVWHLSETGDKLTDSSGKTASKAQNFGSTQSNGRVGKGRSFDAASHQYIDTMNAQDLVSFTIETWVRSPSAPSSMNGPNGPLMREQNYEFRWDDIYAGEGHATFRAEAPKDWFSSDLKPLNANTWYYLAATYDGMKLKTYRDGNTTGNDTDVNTKPRMEANTAKIGRNATGTATSAYFHGDIDEVRISNKARSAGWLGIQAKSMTDNNLVKFNGEDPGGPWPVP
jgi:hypothetical protein